MGNVVIQKGAGEAAVRIGDPELQFVILDVRRAAPAEEAEIVQDFMLDVWVGKIGDRP